MAADFDERAFRQTAGQFATGVTIVAMESGDDVLGMTANSFTTVSLDPPMILFCAGKTTRTGNAIHNAQGFSVNILRLEQQALALFFAGMWKESAPPPYHFVPWSGGPRLEGCAAAIGCALHSITECGDHWIVVGRVLELHQGIEPRRPLLFAGGRFGALERPASAAGRDLPSDAEPILVHYDAWQS